MDALTPDEHEALRLTKELANLMWRVIKAPTGLVRADDGEDWRMFADHLHVIQHMIMSQAAARAYPDKYRSLGSGLSDT